MHPARWAESGKLFNQLQRRQQQMRRPIRPGGFEAEGEALGIKRLQATRRQRRAGHVATQPLQPRPILGFDARGRMQAEKHSAPLRSPSIGSDSTRRTRRPARGPVAK